MKTSNKGSALLSVLWLSAGLASIALAVSSTVRTETDRVEASSNGLRAWYLATGAVERGIQWMFWGEDYRNSDGSAKYWAYNAPRMNLTFPSGDAVIELIPESSKLNINQASAEDLMRVVRTVSGDPLTAQRIVGSILDWRGGGSGEISFSLQSTFRPRHASFEEIEELLAVQGVTPDLFYGNFIAGENGSLSGSGGLRDCLSVWGSLGPFDVNTASPALLQAIGLPPGAVSAIVSRRAGAPFKNLSDVTAMGIPTTRLRVGGNVIWTLRAAARVRTPDGRPSNFVRTASATIKLVDRRRFNIPVHVLRWYDDAWSESAVLPPGASALP